MEADAVYLGIDRLNARRAAENFTMESLADACRFAHLHGVRVYLTANVVVPPSELQEALDMIDEAWGIGVDAVILQDIGLQRIVSAALPHVRTHASTQLNTHSSATLRALVSRGFSRVTLARETSVAEIANLASTARELGAEVESFVHGALCVCYSGQCLFSSLVGGRSANRGQCAQPCRLPYELTDESGRVLVAPGPHLLSTKDLAGIGLLPELISTGVSALKIEGRMKSAEYVALVTGVYRSALDRAAEGESFEVTPGEMAVLDEAFSRGFSEAYLSGIRGNDMMSYGRPNNRGVLVGRVTRVDGRRATVSFDVPADAEDTIEIWTSRGRFAQQLGPLELSGQSQRSVPAGARATFAVAEAASAGDRVFRVRNAALMSAAARTFSDSAGPSRVPIDVSVRVIIGQPLRVEVVDASERRGVGIGPTVEAARTKPVTAEEVSEHVGRFGGTVFTPGSWDIELSPGAGIGFSALHRARREAIEALEQAVLEPWARRATAHAPLPYLPRPYRHAEPAPRLVAVVSDLPTARACLQAGCESVHVPTWALGDDPPPRGVVPILPRVCHDGDADACLRAVHPTARVVAGTLGALARSADSAATVEAHWSLNAMNQYSVAELADMGAGFVWLSPELSSRQVAEVARLSPVPVGVAVVGRQEVLVTEHCVLMSEGECREKCETCKRRTGWRFLRDRKGYSFPVQTDPTGRSHVFNAVPLDLTHALPELLETGVAALRLDLETERANTAAATVARVRQSLQDALAGRAPESQDRRGVTSGHFFRGVT